MCRFRSRPKLTLSLCLLVACSASQAWGDESAGESSWKIVAAPEPGAAADVPRWSSDWDEPPTPAPPAQPAAQTPVVQRSNTQSNPTATAQTAPAERPRPLIPSRQLNAANRGMIPGASLTAEEVRSAIGYSGRATTSQTVSQLPRRTSIVSSPQPARRGGKPFQLLSRDPTISPWLNLYRIEDLSELPNYYAFVRPQFDQLETNRRYQADITHLQREVRNVSTPMVGPQYGAGGAPPTGHTARFMDTAQYYGRWQR